MIGWEWSPRDSNMIPATVGRIVMSHNSATGVGSSIRYQMD
jgi:hypothetical protein